MAKKTQQTITYTHGVGKDKAYEIALKMTEKLSEGKDLQIENKNPPTGFSLKGKIKVEMLREINIDGSIEVTNREIRLVFWVSHHKIAAKLYLQRKIFQAFQVPWHEKPFWERVFG